MKNPKFSEKTPDFQEKAPNFQKESLKTQKIRGVIGLFRIFKLRGLKPSKNLGEFGLYT